MRELARKEPYCLCRVETFDGDFEESGCVHHHGEWSKSVLAQCVTGALQVSERSWMYDILASAITGTCEDIHHELWDEAHEALFKAAQDFEESQEERRKQLKAPKALK